MSSPHPRASPEVLARWRECIQVAAADPAVLEDARTRSLSLNVMTGEETESFVREQHRLLADLWNEDPWIKQ